MAKNDLLQIRINQDTKRKLTEISDELGYSSMSEMVRDIITNKRILEMVKKERI